MVRGQRTGPRVLAVIKRTSYRTFVLDRRDPHLQKLLERKDPTVRRLRKAHDDHETTVREVKDALTALGAHTELVEEIRGDVGPSFDLVLTVGGDGTLLTASHAVGPATPLLGVNSAPDSSVGFFCGARKGTVRETLRSAFEGRLKRSELTRMRVDLNGKVLSPRVLNDALVCHASPAATSRYILRIEHAGRVDEEDQRSSGLWIGPAAGSTAAQKSAGGRVLPLTSKRIQYVVREPYTPIGVPFRLPVGTIAADERLVILSKMRDAKIFLDGPVISFDATVGDVLTLRRSDEPLTVLGLSRNGASKDRKK
jgi:NAD+ kinase